jgi:hypothetical protein
VPLSLDWLSSFPKLILLAAGTGITPMLKLALLPARTGHLLFFNREEKDCCLDSWLDQLEGFRWQHVLSQPSAEVSVRLLAVLRCAKPLVAVEWLDGPSVPVSAGDNRVLGPCRPVLCVWTAWLCANGSQLLSNHAQCARL